MSKKKRTFKKEISQKSKRFNYSPIETISIEHHKHPIFCFKHIHRDYNLNSCDDKEKIAFIDQLMKLSDLSWQEIEYSQRHGIGTEKISINTLKANCPTFITGDIEYLLALRFFKKMPFLVHRNKFIAHVIFIDPKGTLYDH